MGRNNKNVRAEINETEMKKKGRKAEKKRKKLVQRIN